MGRRPLFLLLAAALLAGLAPRAESLPVDCDEPCLRSLLDRYISAVEARDPSRVPLSSRVRFTENSRPMKVGDGFWATATRFGAYRNYFVDVKMQQAGVFAVMSEHGTPGLFTLRIKVSDGFITEAETLVVRQQLAGTFLNTTQSRAKPVWSAKLAPEARLPREEMIRRVDAYFSSTGSGGGKGPRVEFTRNCERFENGVQTAGGLPPLPSHSPATPQPDVMDDVPRGCREQFELGYARPIEEVNPRRYLIVDEARGLVFGVFMFRHPGTLREFDSPGRGKVRVRPNALFPTDVLVAELFKLENGRISNIEAQMVALPYRSDTGWDPR